jgi:RimJ/RimL family protein N-acetyltransferase
MIGFLFPTRQKNTWKVKLKSKHNNSLSRILAGANMPISKYFIKSRRLGFRTWTKDDLQLAIALWGDLEVTKFFDKRGTLSKKQVKTRLLKEIHTQYEHDIQYWPIFILETDEHIGCAGLRPYDLPNRIIEIGFHIKPEYWRQGYASEAAICVMAYAFKNLGATALFAGHNPENFASKKILTRLGFKYTHDEYYEPTGLHHPSYFMTAEEHSILYNE